MRLFFSFVLVFALSMFLVGALPHIAFRQSSPAWAVDVQQVINSVVSGGRSIPQAGRVGSARAADESIATSFPELEEFQHQVSVGPADLLTGVFVPGLLAQPVVQQPANSPEFVSPDSNVITEFSLPDRHGTTGLLAHNYLSGRKFFSMKPGQDVLLIYGDGRIETYRVDRVVHYQALTPSDPYSQFVGVNDPTRTVLSSAELFDQIYTNPGEVIFQTCIEAFGDASWGRMFVTAVPVPSLGSLPEVGQFLSDN